MGEKKLVNGGSKRDWFVDWHESDSPGGSLLFCIWLESMPGGVFLSTKRKEGVIFFKRSRGRWDNCKEFTACKSAQPKEPDDVISTQTQRTAPKKTIEKKQY